MRRGRAREARKKRKLQREMELEKKRKLQREENETKEAASKPRTEETEPKVARTEETEPNEAASKPKMVVNAYDDGEDPKFAAARRGMIAAGYQIDGCRIEEIHCEKAKFTWMENGFCQTYCDVDGKRARVLHYAPGPAAARARLRRALHYRRWGRDAHFVAARARRRARSHPTRRG